MSVLIVAVPDPSSISTTRSAVVGADSAVVATDWSVRFPPPVIVVAEVNLRIITMPEPPEPVAKVDSTVPPPPEPVFTAPAVELAVFPFVPFPPILEPPAE